MVGKSGTLLVDMLNNYGITLYDYCITNVVQCRPPDNADPTTEQMDQCLEHFWLYLDIIKPKFMITVGRISSQRIIFGTVNSKVAISSLEGKSYFPVNYPGIEVIPLTHPAAILRNPTKMPQYEARVEQICKYLREKHKEAGIPLHMPEVIDVDARIYKRYIRND